MDCAALAVSRISNSSPSLLVCTVFPWGAGLERGVLVGRLSGAVSSLLFLVAWIFGAVSPILGADWTFFWSGGVALGSGGLNPGSGDTAPGSGETDFAGLGRESWERWRGCEIGRGGSW